MSCLFCRVVSREIPAEVVYENEHVLAFRDIKPAAPTHALVIPKVHVASLSETDDTQTALLGEVLRAAARVADKLGLAAQGYRVVLNNGEHAGQSVFHLHAHVLGGRALAWPPG